MGRWRRASPAPSASRADRAHPRRRSRAAARHALHRRHARRAERRYPRSALRLADGRRQPGANPPLAGLAAIFARVPIAVFARPPTVEQALAGWQRSVLPGHRVIRADAASGEIEPPAWCFLPVRLDIHSATAIRAVRQRRCFEEEMPIPRASSSAKPRPQGEAIAGAKASHLAEKLLDDGKAEDIVVIDLDGKSAFADYMVIATGRSNRQVVALAERLTEGAEAGRLQACLGRRQAPGRLGAGRCRRRRGTSLPPRAARLL